jgi:hypothetical protein
MASARSLTIFCRFCGRLGYVCRRLISWHQPQAASHTTLSRKGAKLPPFGESEGAHIAHDLNCSSAGRRPARRTLRFGVHVDAEGSGSRSAGF